MTIHIRYRVAARGKSHFHFHPSCQGWHLSIRVIQHRHSPKARRRTAASWSGSARSTIDWHLHARWPFLVPLQTGGSYIIVQLSGLLQQMEWPNWSALGFQFTSWSNVKNFFSLGPLGPWSAGLGKATTILMHLMPRPAVGEQLAVSGPHKWCM